jgi:hypothetical protein
MTAYERLGKGYRPALVWFSSFLFSSAVLVFLPEYFADPIDGFCSVNMRRPRITGPVRPDEQTMLVPRSVPTLLHMRSAVAPLKYP